MFHLGVCFQYGLGIESNTAKAASYYHKSASMGYMSAVYSLGTFYEEGLGGKHSIMYFKVNVGDFIFSCQF